MLATETREAANQEIAILARVLGNGESSLSPTMARYLLSLGFSEKDKSRIHDLAVRNQDGALSSSESEELFAYSKTGTVLSILKSKARRTLKNRPKRRTTS